MLGYASESEKIEMRRERVVPKRRHEDERTWMRDGVVAQFGAKGSR